MWNKNLSEGSPDRPSPDQPKSIFNTQKSVRSYLYFHSLKEIVVLRLCACVLKQRRMFGRVRASSSSPDYLERPSSKILKDDSLSIYEATLMKLKLGSQRDQSSPFEETVEMESESSTTSASSFVESNNTSTTALKSLQHVITSPDEEVMTIDSDSSSSDQLSFSAMLSTGDSKDQRSRNVSVLYLFSKYNYSRQALTPSGEAMLIASSCSASTYASSSNSQSLGISKEQSEHERLSSSSACQM
ncbi:hypothetical protein Peur_069820 [Populus x canadensis]